MGLSMALPRQMLEGSIYINWVIPVLNHKIHAIMSKTET